MVKKRKPAEWNKFKVGMIIGCEMFLEDTTKQKNLAENKLDNSKNILEKLKMRFNDLKKAGRIYNDLQKIGGGV